MSADPGIFLSTSRRGKGVKISEYRFDITGAVTQAPLPLDDSSVLLMFGATAQAVIDDHLGTSSEFTAAQFDATALGADAQGFILDMGGQADELLYVEASCQTGTELLTTVDRRTKAAGLTDSTLDTEAELGAEGNIGIRVDWGNTPDFDALTAGTVILRVHWRAK